MLFVAKNIFAFFVYSVAKNIRHKFTSLRRAGWQKYYFMLSALNINGSKSFTLLNTNIFAPSPTIIKRISD